MGKPAAHISVLLVAVLTFQFAAAGMGRQKTCDFCRRDHQISCCCNCVACVSGRGGLYSYCSSHQGKPDQGNDNKPSLKPLRCTCGSGETFANSKDSHLYLPHSSPVRVAIAMTGEVPMIEIPLNLDDVVPSLDHPG